MVKSTAFTDRESRSRTPASPALLGWRNARGDMPLDLADEAGGQARRSVAWHWTMSRKAEVDCVSDRVAADLAQEIV